MPHIPKEKVRYYMVRDHGDEIVFEELIDAAQYAEEMLLAKREKGTIHIHIIMKTKEWFEKVNEI